MLKESFIESKEYGLIHYELSHLKKKQRMFKFDHVSDNIFCYTTKMGEGYEQHILFIVKYPDLLKNENCFDLIGQTNILYLKHQIVLNDSVISSVEWNIKDVLK